MNARTYHFGLLGHEIAYALSPQIFDLLFAHFETAGVFSVHDVPPDKLAAEVRKLSDLDGFSVTIPYKEKIIPFLDGMSEEAKVIGAVNSVRISKGRRLGHNTDLAGFIYPLRRETIKPARVLILGHGGSARAVLWSLVKEYPETIFAICGRDYDKARSFVDSVTQGLADGRNLTPTTFADILDDDHYDLIVNCTPMGGGAVLDKSPLPETFRFEQCRVCYDLVYQPALTPFLENAAGRGCRTINGLPMLVVQAVTSYALWTHQKLNVGGISALILKKLGAGEG